MQTVLSRTHAPRSTDGSILKRLRLWLDLWSERRELARMDARMLADLGLTAEAARREAGRAAWDIPAERDYGGRYGFDR